MLQWGVWARPATCRVLCSRLQTGTTAYVRVSHGRFCCTDTLSVPFEGLDVWHYRASHGLFYEGACPCSVAPAASASLTLQLQDFIGARQAMEMDQGGSRCFGALQKHSSASFAPLHVRASQCSHPHSTMWVQALGRVSNPSALLPSNILFPHFVDDLMRMPAIGERDIYSALLLVEL